MNETETFDAYLFDTTPYADLIKNWSLEQYIKDWSDAVVPDLLNTSRQFHFSQEFELSALIDTGKTQRSWQYNGIVSESDAATIAGKHHVFHTNILCANDVYLGIVQVLTNPQDSVGVCFLIPEVGIPAAYFAHKSWGPRLAQKEALL